VLRLDKIKLTNFKNYAGEHLSFSPKLNCFVGKNGMGKTNLLDAIYYLCMCKSHFAIRDTNVLKEGEDFFRLEGYFKKKQKKEKIVFKIIPKKKKEIERNDKQYDKLSEHIGLLPVVIIAPDDTILATEGSEERRRFLDNTLSQLDKGYLANLMLYNRVLKQRNAALKTMWERRKFDESLIQTYDKQMIAPAKLIHEQRAAFIADFIPIFNEIYGVIASEAEVVGCVYKSKLSDTDYTDLLSESREKDRVLQRTTTGIHKDDLAFSLKGFPLKRFASQGQLKSYILAMKLAQYQLLRKHKDCEPILLLDDIFDKLDRTRVAQLLSLLVKGEYGQIFITDTHENRVEEIIQSFGKDYKSFLIANGSAQELNENVNEHEKKKV